MSKELRQIQDALYQLTRGEHSIPAQVVSADENECIAEVNGYKYYNVRLRATVDASSGNRLVIVPREKSWVILSPIAPESDTYFVSMVSEVKKVVMNIDGKFVIKNAEMSLKTILNQIVKELKTAKVTTSDGLMPFDPITITKFETIDKYVNQLFE